MRYRTSAGVSSHGPDALDLGITRAEASTISLAEAVRRWGAIGGGETQQQELLGTRRLMVAVLEDGIRAYLGDEQTSREEAEAWVRSRTQGWPFAFETVCVTLALEPDAVRIALHRMRALRLPPRQAIGRTRPNVRRRGRLT